jgi:hypothetical protein
MLGVRDDATMRLMINFQVSQKAVVERKAAQLEELGWEAYLRKNPPAGSVQAEAKKEVKKATIPTKISW